VQCRDAVVLLGMPIEDRSASVRRVVVDGDDL
jgi:hypothetical protein